MFRGSDIPRLLAVAGIVVLSACATDATAPAASGPRVPDAPDAAKAAVLINSVLTTEDSTFVTFTVTSSGGWFVVGANAVYFPANAICEPRTSSYGPGEWDRPCSPASQPVRIVARAGNAITDRGWVHFATDLRFVPSSDPARWVRLYMISQDVKGPRPADAEAREAAYRILWLPHPNATPVDESLDDPTLTTHVLWGTGLVTRRVKHFSGYQVGNGYVEEAAPATEAAY